MGSAGGFYYLLNFSSLSLILIHKIISKYPSPLTELPIAIDYVGGIVHDVLLGLRLRPEWLGCGLEHRSRPTAVARPGEFLKVRPGVWQRIRASKSDL